MVGRKTHTIKTSRYKSHYENSIKKIDKIARFSGHGRHTRAPLCRRWRSKMSNNFSSKNERRSQTWKARLSAPTLERWFRQQKVRQPRRTFFSRCRSYKHLYLQLLFRSFRRIYCRKLLIFRFKFSENTVKHAKTCNSRISLF